MMPFKQYIFRNLRDMVLQTISYKMQDFEDLEKIFSKNKYSIESTPINYFFLNKIIIFKIKIIKNLKTKMILQKYSSKIHNFKNTS